MKRVLPPTYFVLALALSAGLHFLLPIIQLIHSPYRYIGLALIACGAWLTLWADGLFKKEGTEIKPFAKPSVLVVRGPFRFSRNPMYLGMGILLAGVAVLLGSLTSFLSPVTFLLLMRLVFIPYEEDAMQETFGGSYAAYRKRVRRWF